MPMAEVTLEARRLSKWFGTRAALDDVSFTAHAGDIIGLLGPNGAGKTTTIRLLSTVLAPSDGEFSVAGVPGTSAAEIRQRIGVLPESVGYPTHQTGAEYLRYHARLFGLGPEEATKVAARLLSRVGLAARSSSRISTYSRGMRQRLGIARTLVNDPDVVFLDEPTLGLDPAGQREVLDLVRDIAASRGTTVVLSTHTLPEIEEVCTAVLILDKGKVLAAGTVAEVTDTESVRRSSRLRVPVDQVGRARQVLAGFPGVTLLADERPDVIVLALADDGSVGMNAVLSGVVDAGIPVLSFEVEGGRLRDAFLTMTNQATS